MKTFVEFSDDELLLKLQNGETGAFQLIYQRYFALLYKHAIRMTRNEDDAKDIVQEVFITFYQKSLKLELRSTLSGYLYSAVRNKILDAIAKEKVKRSYLNSLDDFVAAGSYQADHLIRQKQLANSIEREIASLPEKMRQVFVLSRHADKSYKEIAAELNITDNTVKKQISNALKILKLKLDTTISIFLFSIAYLLSR